MNDPRWMNEDQLPEDVRAAMRDVLVEALREAARVEDPSDGSMIGLSQCASAHRVHAWCGAGRLREEDDDK